MESEAVHFALLGIVGIAMAIDALCTQGSIVGHRAIGRVVDSMTRNARQCGVMFVECKLCIPVMIESHVAKISLDVASCTIGSTGNLKLTGMDIEMARGAGLIGHYKPIHGSRFTGR